MAARTHRHHLAHSAGIHNPRILLAEVHGFNAKTAVLITDVLGSMACFWALSVLAMLSLPAVLFEFLPQVFGFFPHWAVRASTIALVAWVAQTFIQLTALSVLQVSANAQGRQQEHDTQALLADAEATRDHTTQIIDSLDLKTEGGLKTILDRLDVLAPQKKASPRKKGPA